MSRAQTEQGLFDAALESARIFNWVVAECAWTSGLLSGMRAYTSAAELSARLRFDPGKLPALDALLDVLVDCGLAERRLVDGRRVYRSAPGAVQGKRNLDGGLVRRAPLHDVLEPWFGDRHVERIRTANRHLLGTDLDFFRSPSTKIRFDREFADAWRTNLTNPLYEFGRVAAVRDLVARGRRFLDLAGGLGYGSQRLAEYSSDGCEILLVDKSEDFLSEARLALYPGATVRFLRRDLNHGLPPLKRGSFDGVLFNGSFHFIEDKPARLREIHRALRTGGLLVLGHCYSRSGFEDEPMHDFYFSLLEDRAWPVSFGELRSMVAEAGFQEIRQYHRGSHSYLLAERMQLPEVPMEESR